MELTTRLGKKHTLPYYKVVWSYQPNLGHKNFSIWSALPSGWWGTRDTHECLPLYCLHQWGWKDQVCCSQCPELSLLFGGRKTKTDLVDPRASAVSQHLSLLRGDDDFAFAENRCPSHKTTYLVIETHRTVESSAVHHSCTLAFLHCYAWTA